MNQTNGVHGDGFITCWRFGARKGPDLEHFLESYFNSSRGEGDNR